MIVKKYKHKFFEIKNYARITDDKPMVIQHFVRGLNDRISGGV